MTALDDAIRQGMAEAAAPVIEPDAAELAAALSARRRSFGVPIRRRLGVVAACLVVGALVAGAVALSDSGGGESNVRTGPADGEGPSVSVETTSPPTSIDDLAAPAWTSLGPGWHPLDTVPVPASSSESLAWTGRELVVLGISGGYAYDPEAESWRSIGKAPGSSNGATAVWAGDRVVAVWGGGGTFGGTPQSASWDPDLNTWTDLGEVPVAPALAEAVGPTGSGPTTGGRTALIWTGERVLDVSHGAAFDPATGQWMVMPTPEDLFPFVALLYTDVVWTGTEALAVAWTNHPGLAWNATGTSYREVPGLPEGTFGRLSAIPAAVATTGDDEVVLVAAPDGSDESARSERAAALDPETGEWRALTPPPDVGGPRVCGFWAVTVDERAIVSRCDGVGSRLDADGTWTAIEMPTEPRGFRFYQPASLGGTLVIWDSDADTLYNPEAPYVRAEVWVPPDE